MNDLKRFSLPLQGLKDGMHEFDFDLDAKFFSQFEASPIEEGKFNVQLFFDKRPDMIVMTFDIKGHVNTDCDRCLESIELPVSDTQQLLVKYALVEKEEVEVIYIQRGSSELNVAKYVYEYVCLAIPMIKLCDDIEPKPCNEDMVKYLTGESDETSSNDEQSSSESSSIWDALKNLNQE